MVEFSLFHFSIGIALFVVKTLCQTEADHQENESQKYINEYFRSKNSMKWERNSRKAQKSTVSKLISEFQLRIICIIHKPCVLGVVMCFYRFSWMSSLCLLRLEKWALCILCLHLLHVKHIIHTSSKFRPSALNHSTSLHFMRVNRAGF